MRSSNLKCQESTACFQMGVSCLKEPPFTLEGFFPNVVALPFFFLPTKLVAGIEQLSMDWLATSPKCPFMSNPLFPHWCPFPPIFVEQVFNLKSANQNRCPGSTPLQDWGSRGRFQTHSLSLGHGFLLVCHLGVRFILFRTHAQMFASSSCWTLFFSGRPF